MTVCVGLVTRTGVVYMASDDRVVYDEHVEQAAGRKIVTRTVRAAGGGRVPLLACAAGYLGLSEALRNDDGIYPPVPRGADALDRWADQVAMRWAERARARRCVDKKGDVDGTAMVAVRGRLYDLTESCGAPVARLAAIGSGSAYAYGALYVVGEEILDDDPVLSLALAIEAACAFDRGCAGPVEVARLTTRRAERVRTHPALTGTTVPTRPRVSDPGRARRSDAPDAVRRVRPAASGSRR